MEEKQFGEFKLLLYSAHEKEKLIVNKAGAVCAQNGCPSVCLCGWDYWIALSQAGGIHIPDLPLTSSVILSKLLNISVCSFPHL